MYTIFDLLSDVVEQKNLALMRGGWNYENRRIMLQHWDSYFPNN